MSFRLKTILGIALIEIVLLAILVINGLFYLSSSSEAELLTRGQVTVKLFATMTSDAILSMDLATLDTLVEQTLLNDGIIYVRVRGQEGTILSENGNIDALRQPFKSDDSIASARSDGRLDVSSPILVAGERFGQVEIGLSTGRLEKVLSEARQWMLTIAGLEVGLVAIFGMILGTILTKQLAKLREASKRVAEGGFGYQLPVNGKDELAETTVSFNLMSIALANFAKKTEEARKKAEAGKEYAETVLHDAMHSMPEGVLITDVDNRVTFINESYKKRYAAALENIENNSTLEYLGPRTFALTVEIDNQQKKLTVEDRILLHSNPEQYPMWRSNLDDDRIMMTTQRRMSNGGVVIVEHNITELFDALERNRELELELMETGKMESLGTMASGIAHEINTPLQFISDNVLFFQEAYEDLASVIALISKDKKGEFVQAVHKLDEIDWEFLSEELPKSILDTRAGLKNIGKIVNSIKEFAHPENDNISMHDLNKIIENTIIVSRNQWNTIANVEHHVESGLDAVPCYPGKLGQVLINLIVNAAQAIDEIRHGEKGNIKINAQLIDDVVEITVEDDGPGIPDDKINQVFDMFFTTKTQGAGSGQGLAICKSIIENTHMGKLSVSSVINKGTTFVITLPFSLKSKDI